MALSLNQIVKEFNAAKAAGQPYTKVFGRNEKVWITPVDTRKPWEKLYKNRLPSYEETRPVRLGTYVTTKVVGNPQYNGGYHAVFQTLNGGEVSVAVEDGEQGVEQFYELKGAVPVPPPQPRGGLRLHKQTRRAKRHTRNLKHRKLPTRRSSTCAGLFPGRGRTKV